MREKSVHILPLGMDERKIAILRTAFRMYQSEHYEIVEKNCANPDLAIIDIDSPEGRGVLDHFFADYPELPYLVTSIERIDSLEPFLVLKPLRIETLFPKLKEIRKSNQAGKIVEKSEISKPSSSVPQFSHTKKIEKAEEVSAVSNKPTSNVEPKKEKPKETVVAPVAKVEKKTPEIVLPPPARVELNLSLIRTFNPEKGLLGLLKRLEKDELDVVVLYREEAIFVVKGLLGKVYLLVSLSRLQVLCSLSEEENRYFSVSEVPLTLEFTQKFLEIKLTNLLWQFAIWSANGRLCEQITVNKILKLKSWPNFTRLAPIPDSMRITAFLMRTPVTLAMLAKFLNVESLPLFNFLAATYAINILDIDVKPAMDMEVQKVQPLHNEAEVLAVKKRPSLDINQGKTVEEPTVVMPRPRTNSFLQKFLTKLSNK